MTLIELIYVIVGAALGFLVAPHLMPHITSHKTLAVALTYVLALVMGIGTFVVVTFVRIMVENALRKKRRK